MVRLPFPPFPAAKKFIYQTSLYSLFCRLVLLVLPSFVLRNINICFQDSVWGSSSTTSTDVWAGPPSWDPIVLGEDEEDDDDSGGYAYGDIKWVHSRLDMAK